MFLHDEVTKELERAESKFPDYHSFHEGYAVLKEEVEELEECLEELKYGLDMYWRAIRNNGVRADNIERMIIGINDMGKELVQVAAVLVRHRRLIK